MQLNTTQLYGGDLRIDLGTVIEVFILSSMIYHCIRKVIQIGDDLSAYITIQLMIICFLILLLRLFILQLVDLIFTESLEIIISLVLNYFNKIKYYNILTNF